MPTGEERIVALDEVRELLGFDQIVTAFTETTSELFD
jgi:hypothetical protein